MTTRDETVWDRDALTGLALALADALQVEMRKSETLAAERAKRGVGPNVETDPVARLWAVWHDLGATGDEDALDAARRVVRERDEARKERDAARELAAQLTAERDALKASPAPEAFDAAMLKVGDRVRLREATVKTIYDRVVWLDIDGETNASGVQAQTAVYSGAIAGRVSP